MIGSDGISEQHDDELRIFTVEEARMLIPELRPMLQAMQEQKQELDELRRQFRKLTPAMRGNGQAEEAAELDQRIREQVSGLRRKVEEVTDLGVLIKDIDQGLVDFPALRDGRAVLLCWKADEPDLAYWHEMEAGFAGRQPIDWE